MSENQDSIPRGCTALGRVALLWSLSFFALAGAHAEAPVVNYYAKCANGECERFVVSDAAATTDLLATSNRAENGDYSLAGQLRAWSPYTLYGGVGVPQWASNDSGGAPNSGSVRLTNSTVGPSNQFSYVGGEQCVRPGDVVPGQSFTVTAKIFVPPGQATPTGGADVTVWAIFFDAPDCTGFFEGWGSGFSVLPAGTSGWQTTTTVLTIPAQRSVLIRVELGKRGDVVPVEAYLDSVGYLGPFGFVKGDIDRDGETDLILHHNTTGANAAWFMKDENRIGGPTTLTPAPASLNWQIAGVDDFNADGQNDLLFWDSVSGASEFWLMNGTTRVEAAVPLADALALPWRPSATADFNHDAKPDIVWRNNATQKLAIWPMNGTSQLGTIIPSPDQAVDANWAISAAQDLNGDGNTDFLWYNATSGKIVYWWMNAGVVRIIGNFTNPPNAGANNWNVLAGGDYGIGPSSSATALAGTNDIVWRNATSGRLVLWFMDNAGNRTSGLFVTPDPPAPATDWTVAGPR